MEDFYLYRKAWRFNGAPHEEPRLQQQEWKALLKKGGVLVRNTYDFDGPGETSFWYVIKDHFGGMEELSGNTRRKIKRSLEQLDFRIIDVKTLEQEGYPLLKATMKDYTVTDRITNKKSFMDYLALCRQQPHDYWGIYDRERQKMIGFCENRIWDNACEYGLIAVLPEYKRKSTTYPYYGLFYRMNQYYLQEKGFRYVSDGSRSITEHSHIHAFLEEKFMFRKSYCRLSVHYRQWLSIAVKMLYPFRKLIPIPQVKAILSMEAMQHHQTSFV